MQSRTESPLFLRNAQLLVFDFDGTLVDSNEIKWRGFETVFADHPEKRDEIAAYCRGSNHIVRGEKFRHVCESILQRRYDAGTAAALHRKYALATTHAVIEAPEIPGSRHFLQTISGQYETALLSSTPHQTLLSILKARCWTGFFEVVQGAPVNKAQWLARIRCEKGLSKDQVVFFGDTSEDIVSGRKAGCTVVAVANESASDGADHYIGDFTELISL